jgi:threonine/homoserine/homoserine lactone efflux protein
LLETISVLPVWSFLAVTLPLVLTPGASTAVVLRNSIGGGVRAGVETAAGVNSGSVVYGFLSAFGLAIALRRWPSAWMVLRLAGGGYLAWLGVRSLYAAIRPRAPRPNLVAAREPRATIVNLYEGFLTNLFNPAIATFYLVVVPQFVPRGAPVARSVLSLMLLHVTTALSWHLVWAAAGGTLARTITTGPARRVLDGATAAALVFLAVRLLMSTR